MMDTNELFQHSSLSTSFASNEQEVTRCHPSLQQHQHHFNNLSRTAPAPIIEAMRFELHISIKGSGRTIPGQRTWCCSIFSYHYLKHYPPVVHFLFSSTCCSITQWNIPIHKGKTRRRRRVGVPLARALL